MKSTKFIPIIICLSLALQSCRADIQNNSAETSSYGSGNGSNAGGSSFLRTLCRGKSETQSCELISISLMLNRMHQKLGETEKRVNSNIISAAFETAGMIIGGTAALVSNLLFAPFSMGIYVVGWGGGITANIASQWFDGTQEKFANLDKEVDKLIADMKSLDTRFKEVWDSADTSMKQSIMNNAEKYLNYGQLSLENKSTEIGFFYKFKLAKLKMGTTSSGSSSPTNTASTSTSSLFCSTTNKRVITLGSTSSRADLFTDVQGKNVLTTVLDCSVVCLVDKSAQLVRVKLESGREGYIDRNQLSTPEGASRCF